MTYDPKVLFFEDIAKISFGMVIPEWIKDWKFHLLAEVVHLKKPPLKRGNNSGLAHGHKQLFYWIQIDL